MQIRMLSTDSLKAYENNARSHSEEQIKEIAESIQEFGFNNPILIDENKMIIAGHGRLLAAKKLCLTEIPTLTLPHLTDTKKRAYILADNRIALNAGWSPGKLKEEFEALLAADFDIKLTGFTSDEIDAFLNPELLKEGLDDANAQYELPKDPVTKMGDVWLLGTHRVMCGDSVSITDIDKLRDNAKPDMMFTDPPYGMNYSGRGKNTSNKIINDNADPTEFYNLMPEIKERYIWGRVENYSHLLTKPRDVIVWKKNNFGMGSGYRGQYEVCFYYGDFKGSDSDVWEVNKDTAYEHPTQKPIELAERAIKNSKPKVVIDLFGGSGSTLIACEKTGRKCLMMEISPAYCDVIVRRWEKFSGKKGILESTQQPFDEVSNG